MAGRIDELRALRAGLASGDSGALDAAKRVAQALRGSGGTFGYPELTAVAALVETSAPTDTHRRVEGLIEYLHRLRHAAPSPTPVRAEWLAGSAGVTSSGSYPDLPSAWTEVATKAGLTQRGLAERAARSLGLGVANLSKPSRAALRLVPEALMRGALALPTGEDEQTITVASADPTLLTAELELLRLTGRRPVFTVASPEELTQAFVALLEMPTEPSPMRRKVVTVADTGTQGTVLLVDDDPGALLFARRVLEKSGYPVIDASNGREALERLDADGTVALVVADLNMPELDGLELIWEMRDVDRWAHIPVIVLTGETDELLEAKLIEEGADDYLSKPFDPRMFVARVGATMRRAEGAEVQHA
jgi:two-component system alkaline phosphatase synthesis response regulator PhoP